MDRALGGIANEQIANSVTIEVAQTYATIASLLFSRDVLKTIEQSGNGLPFPALKPPGAAGVSLHEHRHGAVLIDDAKLRVRVGAASASRLRDEAHGGHRVIPPPRLRIPDTR